MPKGVGPYDVCYGLKVFRDCSAGELVSPAKSQKQVKQESAEGLELYKMSHSAYEVGKSLSLHFCFYFSFSTG